MKANEKEALEALVRDHTIQAGIGLAVALGVWHWKGQRKNSDAQIWLVSEIITALKDQETILISDADGILHCEGRKLPGATGEKSSLRWVSRVAYVGAVAILGANAINVHRQLRDGS